MQSKPINLDFHLSITTNIVFIHSFKNLSKYHIHLFIRLKICQNIVFINSFIKKNAIISYSFIHSLKNLPKYHIRLFIHLKVWYNIVFIYSFIYDISRYHARLHPPHPPTHPTPPGNVTSSSPSKLKFGMQANFTNIR